MGTWRKSTPPVGDVPYLNFGEQFEWVLNEVNESTFEQISCVSHNNTFATSKWVEGGGQKRMINNPLIPNHKSVFVCFLCLYPYRFPPVGKVV